MSIRLSIIVPFLNSHEIVRRQVAWMKKQDLPDDVEIIYLDDGSEPPLEAPDPPRNFRLVPTKDKRPWTSSLARNVGAWLARGEYLFMTDGDYIITREAVERARRFDGDRLGCRRRFGVLDENCELRNDRDTLRAWGLGERWVRKHGWTGPHPNNFVMRKSLFFEMGGYDLGLIVTRDYPQKEDTAFKRKLMKMVSAGQVKMDNEDRPVLFMFPNGQFCYAEGSDRNGDVDANPFGLFHALSRKTPHNHWYLNQREIGERTPCESV